jgi:vacuolar-type H+-ATPase subunit I/STV1
MSIHSVAEAVVPLATKTVGWSSTTWVMTVLCALVTPVFIAALKFLISRQTIEYKADGSLRTDLLARIGAVERAQAKEREAFATERAAFVREITQERKDCERRLDGMQKKMDAVTRQFVQFQLIVAGSIPADKTPMAQAAVERLLEIVSQDVSVFESVEHDTLHELSPRA